MYELFLSIISGIAAIYSVYQVVNFKPNPSKPNVTRPRLIVATIFLTVCAIGMYSFGYNTPERKEANYINSVLKEFEKGDRLLKGTKLSEASNDDMAKIIQKINKIKNNVNELSPPDTMPSEILTAQETMVRGLDKIAESIKYVNLDTFYDGSDLTGVSLIFYKYYLSDHSDVKNLIKTKYIDIINDKT
ncbi:hypothetical protein Q5427_11135 [Brochothrix thermosphacta]|uniref:hypothetical protein n=1 Tax=Brochothrix thermosphacta TaxID=2756 RepID=UPI002713E5B1|nr:hypothetical protein [Brochothrix thermosphacta]MDO7864843.1 hypothetical protein [Brochothrix thermosphacta]